MTGLPYNYAVSYSESFGGKLAVAVNFGHRKLFTPQDTVAQTSLALPNGVTAPIYTNQVQYTDERLLTSRSGVEACASTTRWAPTAGFIWPRP